MNKNKFFLDLYQRELKKIKKRLEEIDCRIDYNPVTDLLKAREDFVDFLEKYKGEDRTSKKAIKEFNEIKKRDDNARKEIKNLKGTNSLNNEKLDLEFKISFLNSEIYYYQRKIDKNNY